MVVSMPHAYTCGYTCIMVLKTSAIHCCLHVGVPHEWFAVTIEVSIGSWPPLGWVHGKNWRYLACHSGLLWASHRT